jgi:hypothetical protein
MYKVSTILKKGVLALSLCLAMILWIGLTAPRADAVNYENAYINDLHFYYDATDDLVFQFHALQTFNMYYGCQNCTMFMFSPSPSPYDWARLYVISSVQGGNQIATAISPTFSPFVAGTTYKIYLKHLRTFIGYNGWEGQYGTKAQWETNIGRTMNATDILYNFGWGYYAGIGNGTILAYFDPTPPPPPVPTLNVFFPDNNEVIGSKFYVEGEYTMPVGSPYNTLQIFLGKESETGMITSFYFSQPISPPSGSFSIPITGVPAGHYAMAFNLIDKDHHQIYLMMTEAYRTIEIVNDIPPELPITGETPPVISGQFSLIDPSIYYASHSDYATSTSVYNSLTSALAPLIQSTGQNLSDFALQFPQTSARETGERIGNAVLSARAYVANLNAFFADLPVATFFVLYLALLLAVILFRLVKGIISLFKL